MSHSNPHAAASGEKRFFGHPYPLSYLFHIELWERFSYYGMQGILLIYMYWEVTRGGLGWDKTQAGAILGAYSGSVYLSTIIGGWLADRVLGKEKTLFYSGIVVMCGHIVLGLIPGAAGLFCGLVLVALGSGGVKSSASAMVGSLYESEELRPLRDAGFSIFYISVNIGGFFGPLLTGLLQQRLGFHYGFGIAAVGMAFGLFLYTKGRKNIPPQPPANPLKPEQRKFAWLIPAAFLAMAGVVGSLLGNGTLDKESLSRLLLVVVITITVVYFTRILASAGRESVQKRNYVIAYIPLFLVICAFWALWYQIWTALTVYFDETVPRTIGSFTVPVSWKDSLGSMYVVLFAGLLAALWTKMGKRQPKTPLKFVMSMLVLGATYLAFIPYLNSGTAMPLAVFALVWIGTVLAELLLSPISLSLATKIAPEGFQTQMVALGFLALSIGMTGGGVLFRNYYDAERAADFYWLIGGSSIVVGLLLLLLVPLLNRLLEGID